MPRVEGGEVTVGQRTLRFDGEAPRQRQGDRPGALSVVTLCRQERPARIPPPVNRESVVPDQQTRISMTIFVIRLSSG